ncbi:hypothetical protein [Clavibacter capsici]|uniref:hypothetical protein n=1 Tax=Clavibacter capsici TaxID=1874630 RepID=UPI00142833C1|nr:hypothetical protein [Clavibacter capsici]QIS38665.1 hypothetical protein GW572_04635 [Clavibacter capsici]
MTDPVYITYGHKPPLTSEQMTAHMNATAKVLGERGIPVAFVTQAPRLAPRKHKSRRLLCALLGHRAGYSYWNKRTNRGETACSRCGYVGKADRWGKFVIDA